MHASNDTNNQNRPIHDDQNPDPPSTEETAPDQPRGFDIETTPASNELNNQNHNVHDDQSQNPQSTRAAPDQTRVNEEVEDQIKFSVRNLLLTATVLLASATYQTVYNPPGGLWQEDGPDTVHDVGMVPSSAAGTTVHHPAGPVTEIKRVAGVSILGTKDKNFFIAFILGNTLGFMFSMATIEDLTRSLMTRRRWKLRLAIFAISITYCISVYVITPYEYQLLTCGTLAAATVVVLVLQLWI